MLNSTGRVFFLADSSTFAHLFISDDHNYDPVWPDRIFLDKDTDFFSSSTFYAEIHFDKNYDSPVPASLHLVENSRLFVSEFQHNGIDYIIKFNWHEMSIHIVTEDEEYAGLH